MKRIYQTGLPKFVIFHPPKTEMRLYVHLLRNSVWLSPEQMVELFDKDLFVIQEHIFNIYNEKLFNKTSFRNFRVKGVDGKRRKTRCYSLDVIISVGYRVNSKRSVEFCIWAHKIIKKYLIQEFVIKEEKVKDQKTVTLINIEDTVQKFAELVMHPVNGRVNRIADSNYQRESLEEWVRHQPLKSAKSGARRSLVGIIEKWIQNEVVKDLCKVIDTEYPPQEEVSSEKVKDLKSRLLVAANQL